MRKLLNFKNWKFMAALCCLVLILLIAVISFLFSGSGDVETEVTSTLKEIVEIEELSTVEYTYNSIVQINDEDGKKVKYYAAYNGTVKAGIDMNNVTVSKNKNIITISIPDIKITDIKVHENLDYIFTNKKYDTETTFAEAYNHCCTDLKNKAENNKSLKEMAQEGAIETLEALIKPFVDKYDEYTFNIECK